jgi:hypothetical protein
MKILVLCDDHGDIQSVAMPNPAMADRINVQIDGGGRAHKLDVDRHVVDPEALRSVASDKARKDVHDRLRKMIASSK